MRIPCVMERTNAERKLLFIRARHYKISHKEGEIQANDALVEAVEFPGRGCVCETDRATGSRCVLSPIFQSPR